MNYEYIVYNMNFSGSSFWLSYYVYALYLCTDPEYSEKKVENKFWQKIKMCIIAINLHLSKLIWTNSLHPKAVPRSL